MQNHEKILQYEVFLSERLQPDLTAAQLQRSELEGQLKEYEDLQQNLKLLQEVRRFSRSHVLMLAAIVSSSLWWTDYRLYGNAALLQLRVPS